MSSSTPFYAFIELVQFDQKLNECHKEIKELSAQIAALEKEQAFLTHQKEQAKIQYQRIQMDVDDKELEMKMLDDTEQAKKKLLEHTNDLKIYQAIKSEIASIKRKQHGLEDQLVKSWNALETAKKTWESLVKTLEEKSNQMSASKALIEQEIAQKKQFLDVESQKRNQFEARVLPEWIEKYNVMKSRVTNPVVPVMHGMCSVCFYKVSDQDMIRMNDQELAQCKDCFRLLYLPEVMEIAHAQDQVQI